ncbi:caspase-18 isoform X1 [Monodelphis domestica]|uniref:Caspase-8 n=1 Tax=Monodelphis domestica TaxID=13616 RepID=K7E316_MONDO|nr:caspase-18 isoform X1 [Monodelphis domestica]
MDEILLQIKDKLTRSDLESLKFLSSDIIPLQKQENITRSLAFFQALQKRELLDNNSILEELLFLIGRKDILTKQLNVNIEELKRKLQHSDSLKISPYRKLLFKIAENMTSDYLDSAKFLLRRDLPQSKLEGIKTPLKLFIEMEKHGLIEKTNLKALKDILQSLNAECLLKHIKEYEKKTKDLAGSAVTAQLESHLGHLSLLSGNAGQAAAPLNIPEESEMNTLPQSMPPYKMEHVPHGYVVIIDNIHFSNPVDVRIGTEKDVAALRKVFGRLQFKEKYHSNLDASQLHEVMKDYSKRDYTDQDAFICCILSHGKKGVVLGTDWKPVAIKKLLSYFTANECKTLKDKPKLFFIQACQNGKSDSLPEVDVEFDLEADAICSNTTHEWSDIFIGMATVEDSLAQRSGSIGSPYIQNLCKELEAHCPQKKELLEIMTSVNSKVSNIIQMPEFRSTLRAPFIFQVPEESQKAPIGH